MYFQLGMDELWVVPLTDRSAIVETVLYDIAGAQRTVHSVLSRQVAVQETLHRRLGKTGLTRTG